MYHTSLTLIDLPIQSASGALANVESVETSPVKEDEKVQQELQSPEVQANEGEEGESKGKGTKKVVKKVVKKTLDKVISFKGV